MRIVLLLTASMLPTPLSAVVAQSVAPATRNAAETLAATVLPRDAIVAVRLPRFDAAYAEELATDKRIAALERTHPGITKAVAGAAHDEAEIGYTRALDVLRTDVAALYRSRFTQSELETLARFFVTPTGQALISLSADASGDTASAFEADRRRRIMAMLQNPDERAKADLTRLMSSGLLPKVRAINPEISTLSARRFDDVATLVGTALPARVEATIADYISKAKP